MNGRDPVRIEIDMSPALIHALSELRVEMHRHLQELERMIVTSKQELLDKLAEVKKDQKRILDKLKAALEAQNLDDVAAAVDELDASLEAADPEAPTDPTPL